MTRELAIKVIKRMIKTGISYDDGYAFEPLTQDEEKACGMAIKALEQEPKTGHCKDCKHWKDSDGVYRRDVHAESKCPINTKTVYLGEGYCYKFEPKNFEVKQ